MSVSAYEVGRGGLDVGDLVMRHAELVKRIAYHLAGRLPPSVEVDDLIQAGMLGLLEAAGNFAADRGASFETYAGIRIRGAMLDALRKLDWAPRSVHRKARAAAAAMREVEVQTGREARDIDVAQRMGVSIADYHHIMQDAVSCRLTSLDATAGDNESPLIRTADAKADPLADTVSDGFRRSLAHAITELPERERLVMSLYYDEELNLKEIGAILKVTESRICQLHGQALTRLKARLSAWRDESLDATA